MSQQPRQGVRFRRGDTLKVNGEAEITYLSSGHGEAWVEAVFGDESSVELVSRNGRVTRLKALNRLLSTAVQIHRKYVPIENQAKND